MNFTPNKLKKFRTLSFLLIFPLLHTQAFALAGNEGYLEKPSEFELERMAPRTDLEMLSTNLAGENISLADGGLSFSATDVSIPLNMAINAVVSRSYDRLSGQNDREAAEFGDWKLDLPRIESTYLKGDGSASYTPNYYSTRACSEALAPGPIMAALGQNINQHEYWNGATLTIPGQGGGKLLNRSTNGLYGTTDNMAIDCGEDSSGNEFFIVKTPNGLTYTLKQRRIIQGDSLVRSNKSVTRKRLLYLVTEIADRFGNKLNYQYQGNGLLQYIKQTPLNGAQETLVTLTYTSNRVTSISSFGKTWRYEYEGKNLSKAIRPDNKFWHYQFPSFGNYAPDIILNRFNDLAAKQCDYKLSQGGTGMMRVTHPYGSVAEFDYALQVHGRTEVPAKDMRPISYNTPQPSYNINSCYATLSVTNKRLTINNDNTYTWQYQFSNNGQHWNIVDWNPIFWGSNSATADTAYLYFNDGDIHGGQKASHCLSNAECSQVPRDWDYEPFDLRVLTVTEPDNSIIKYYTSKRWDHTDGKVVATQWFDNASSSALRTEIKTFTQGPDKGTSFITDPVTTTNLTTVSRQTLALSTVIIENENTYTQSFDSYDDFGALLESHSYNSFNNKVRYVQQSYYDDKSNWVLSLPLQSRLSTDGDSWKSPHKEVTYYGENHAYKSKSYKTMIMGQVVAQNSSYHSDGNLRKIDYTGTGRYELFEDYKRGKARKVTLPCQKVNNCNTSNGSTSNTVIAKLIINDDGSVDRVTDFKGYATNYDYNSMGWLSKIDPADNKWSNTNISYDVVNTANDGLPGSGAEVGQLKQTISQGNSQKLTYFDGMLRPYLTRTRDTSNSATTSYQRNEYDFKNRTTFSSFSDNDIFVTYSNGVGSDFDALGRKTRQTRTTDNTTTEYDYLTNNRVLVKDPKGNITTTTYLAYGSPSQLKATNISTPKGATTINYNLFDQVETISQGGFTEYRFYDGYQQLCKTKRLDTGITAFGYNSAGKMVWQQEGASGESNDCNVTANDKTSISYNNWGEVRLEDYPNGSPDKAYNYDEGGQLETLTAGGTSWSYQYNSLGMVEKQTLTIDNKNFVIDPDYNSLGHMKSLKYPSGRVVDFAPNALGQATQAGIYAFNAKYHANGSLNSFTYGNDLTYKRSITTSQQPFKLSVMNGSSYKSNLHYFYDDNSNVSAIEDHTNRSFDINLGYDGLDRLVTASSIAAWGNASFSYDNIGNILEKTMGGETLKYHYEDENDVRLNRLMKVSGSLTQTFDYDERGNVTNNGRYSLTFNRANQLTNANGNVYTYDGHNRLVKKVSNGKTVYSVYDLTGTLYYREDAQQKKNDYIRLGKELVAKDNTIISTPPAVTPINSPPTVSGSFIRNRWGLNHFSVNWQSSGMNNITYFELYKSGDATTPPPNCLKNCIQSNAIKIAGEWVRAYSGSNLSFQISTVSDSIDVKARACNSLGCGPYSPVNTLTTSVAW